MTSPAGLWLGSASLLSKWGFEDGSVPVEAYDWLEDGGRLPEGYPRGAGGGGWPDHMWLHRVWDAVLVELVRSRLLPVLDQRVEVFVIGGHNPVRAESVDGVPVPERVLYDPRAAEPRLTPDGVLVPWDEVMAVAWRLAGDAAPPALVES